MKASDITANQFIKSMANVCKMAKSQGWRYGWDLSKTPPPCSNKIVDCATSEARALWDLGFTDQPAGGCTNWGTGSTQAERKKASDRFENYLPAHGFETITHVKGLLPGDIVTVCGKSGNLEDNTHTFTLTEYNAQTQICSKYDTGSDARIKTGAFSANVPLLEWSDRKFYRAWRATGLGGKKRLATKGTAYVIESAVNKAYCLDIASGTMADKGNVQIYKKNKSEAQQFIIQYMKDGYVRIVNKKSGLCVDVSDAKVSNKNNIWQYHWNGTKAQLWNMVENGDGTVTFFSALNEKYTLDCSEGVAKNWQNVWLYKSNKTKAQKWYLRKV